MKKDVHKINFANLETLSDEVFDLEKQYKLILQSIAVRKNTPNLDDIEKFVARSDTSNGSRSAVRRRLNGSSTLIGLVPFEYVIGIPSEKRHYQNEKDYYLTLKGMLATLSSGVTIDIIYSFNCYFDFLSKIIKDEKIYYIAKQYIKNQIQYFLSWHAVSGIQLPKLTQSFIYIQNFFDSYWDDKVKLIPWSMLSKHNSIELKKVIEKQAMLEKSLDKIQKKNLFSNILIKQENMFFDKIIYDNHNRMSVYFMIKYWYWFIEKLQLDYWEKSSLDDVAIQNPVYLSDIEVSDLITKITNRSNLCASRLLKKNKI